MYKEMNKLLQGMIKYDLWSGILVSLIISITYSFINAGIYFVGILVSLINFLISSYIISKCLGRQDWMIALTYFLRMGFILVTIAPFVRNSGYLICYMLGFVSHYIVLIVSNLKNREGSE